MKQKTVSGVLLTLLLIGILTFVFNIQPVKADWTWTETIYIRIDGSVDPDTAPVSSTDNITYTFTDNIVGDVPEDSSAIVVERDNIVIDGKGYALQGTGSGNGFSLSGRSNVTIQNMEVTGFGIGISLNYSSSNSISGNTITNNTYGFYFASSSYNSISGNNITDNFGGILLASSSFNNSVSGNSITNNRGDGVGLSSSFNNSVSGNSITNNTNGVDLLSSFNNSVSGNSITNNTSSSGVRIRQSSFNSVCGNCITNNYAGIDTFQSSNNIVFGNNITYNEDGVWLSHGSGNSISGNNITGNNLRGIYLNYLDYPSNTTVSGNSITNNTYGIRISSSSNSIIYHNNFADNSEQVFSFHSTNLWDNGFPSGGNYWGDHVIVDHYSGINQDELGSDGVGDIAHEIDANNQDNYPLMGPINCFNAGTWGGATYQVDTVSNSTVSDFYFSESEKLISFNIIGPDGAVGFCRVTIPNVLLGGPYVVLINDSPPLNINEQSSATHTFIYFTYNHSTKQIEITGATVIPEFSTWITILLLIIVISVAMVMHKRRSLKTSIH